MVQGEVVGVEALLRWSHETYGEISPVEFIPIAETSRLIVKIGDGFLRKSCEQTLKWQTLGLPPVPIAVNLLDVQFKRTDLVEAVGNLIGEFQIEPSWLELEITGSMIMDNVEETVSALHGLHDIGVSLAIDDFGTGHSSLAYLKRFPMDKLKIDRSFVND
ncbi:MAG: EAL domain-containing protein, partial [Pseudomonadota bacterium]|nr:EAL domain-containing protein [Pseudomonadota bacterium]